MHDMNNLKKLDALAKNAKQAMKGFQALDAAAFAEREQFQ